MSDAVNSHNVRASLQRLVDAAQASGRGDDDVIVLLDELRQLVVDGEPRGGALSDVQVAFLLESGAFTPDEFAAVEEGVAGGELAGAVRMTRLQVIADSLGTSDVAGRLGVDMAKVDELHVEGALNGFLVGDEHRYPLWQFTNNPARPVLPHLAALVRAIPDDVYPATVHGFMTTPQHTLLVDGVRMTPVQWLLRGEDPQAVTNLFDSFMHS
ncbi:hypothetical protein [Plantibacter sp. YIM 135249]|uniref:hypothetical protein n=1 Tax=Plantibacter sp. YIM 135249 TaxID=3423918 RepID=UPI003D34D549